MAGIRIYRAGQIGGCVTEIINGEHRIIIDFGANLPGAPEDAMSDEEVIREVFGTDSAPKGADAVLFTHYHGDHVGLKTRIPEDIPLYAGETAKEVMRIIAGRTDYLKRKKGQTEELELPVIDRMQPYWHVGSSKDFGGIRVTPFTVNHSALDAYMFLLEVNGKRSLYTGDFRDHGTMRPETFENMIRTYVKKVDILVTEGTMVLRLDKTDIGGVRNE